jgi:protein-S-isoprenylcysteine O-methyltransferase Ste14
MSLRHNMESAGSQFFRYRSYLPLLLLPLAVDAIASFSFIHESHEATESWQFVCLGVSLFGLGLRVMTVGFVPRGTSGRNTSRQLAVSLNTTGAYSVVRHPLYLGNYFIFLGFTLFFHSWQFTLVATCLFALYYERIMLAEEEFLRVKFGAVFEDWAAKTPAIIPRLTGWKSPAMPFSWRSVLGREYSVVLLIVFVFWALDTMGDSLVERRLIVDGVWVAVLMSGVAMYLVLMILKKHTLYLHAAGR